MSENESKNHVVDFNQVRAEKMDEKRRKGERIFFQQLLSVYCVTENEKIKPIELVEVSEEGCSFQIKFDPSNPWPQESTEALVIRLYFSQDTYIPLHLKIENSRPCIEAGQRYVRFGCSVDKMVSSYLTYQQFIRFLKLYSENAHKDKGNTTLFYL